ncbi:MAG: hypothetical protein H0V09_05980 [Gemmatimonadetes bacterium]|nr:hypothetical protein [Gemmatimonadota bacterium]
METQASQGSAGGPDLQPEGGAGGTGSARPAPDLTADLRTLGENLRDTLRAAWESREREHLQSEIEQGLRALGSALGQTFESTAHEFRAEPLREKVVGLREKVTGVKQELRTTPVADRVRAEIHEVLGRLNEQLRQSRTRWTPPDAQPQERSGDEDSRDPEVSSPSQM